MEEKMFFGTDNEVYQADFEQTACCVPLSLLIINHERGKVNRSHEHDFVVNYDVRKHSLQKQQKPSPVNETAFT